MCLGFLFVCFCHFHLPHLIQHLLTLASDLRPLRSIAISRMTSVNLNLVLPILCPSKTAYVCRTKANTPCALLREKGPGGKVGPTKGPRAYSVEVLRYPSLFCLPFEERRQNGNQNIVSSIFGWKNCFLG